MMPAGVIWSQSANKMLPKLYEVKFDSGQIYK